MPTREELKALRLKAMGVVGGEMQKSADMYNRVIGAGAAVGAARDAAEAAHMTDLQNQVADLNEMAEELAEFGQTADPTKAAQSGAKQSASSSAPATATAPPSPGSAALDALMKTQPNPPGEKQTITAGEVGSLHDVLNDGNAYHGTSPPKL